ncbi:MAG: hypothetical protein ACTSPV_00910 [Candidatus Hodarchaeales archaeon]
MEKYTICVDRVDSHVHLRIFINGALAGKLCLRFEEYVPFWGIFSMAEANKPKHYTINFEDDLFWEKYSKGESDGDY